MRNNETVSTSGSPRGDLLAQSLPLVLVGLCLLTRFYLLNKGLGEPDSFREARSALLYAQGGVFERYWDHPLNLYILLLATKVSFLFNLDHQYTCNAFSALLGSASLLPLYVFSEKVWNRRVAIFLCLSLILSPFHIRYSTYYIHEMAGFFFFCLALFLFQLALERREIAFYFLFGIGFGALVAARIVNALLILPLLGFLAVREFRGANARQYALLAAFSAVGLAVVVVCLFPFHVLAGMNQTTQGYFARFYSPFGFVPVASKYLLEGITLPLFIAGVASTFYLVYSKNYFIVLLLLFWIAPFYLFYTGIAFGRTWYVSRYFLCLLPAALLAVYCAADDLVRRVAASRFPRLKTQVASNCVMALLLVAVILPPLVRQMNLFLFLRSNDVNKVLASQVHEIVSGDLLLVSSFRPILEYHNVGKPLNVLSVLDSREGGKVGYIRDEGVATVREHLRENRPVYATSQVLGQFKAYSNYDVRVDPVWHFQETFGIYRVLDIE